MPALGYKQDDRLLALNSLENRVYQDGIEGGEPLIAKFYRRGRWSDAAIREEHAYAQELVDAELPIVAPLVLDGNVLPLQKLLLTVRKSLKKISY